jgi:uncharacterized protein YecE (DUF72 family)
MQNSLFGDNSAAVISSVDFDPSLNEIANALPHNLRLGTSSWSYPGWTGIVWAREYSETKLSRYGLPAYSKHPLFRCVGIDRGFYKPLSIAEFATYAAQVPDDFRFVVKAPSLVTDALSRDEEGRGKRINNNFLNPDIAVRDFIEPALEGLGKKLGALVFQISPLPYAWLQDISIVIERLRFLLESIPDLKHKAVDGVVAVEVRDPQWLTRDFVHVLRQSHATYCMGLHAKMPHITEQLPILRALWPGPLVCRWNLNPLHGAYGYEDAERQYDPYDRIQDPDPETRNALARVIAGTVGAGQNAYVTLSNQAEGCSPLSIVELARSVRTHLNDRNKT